MSYYYEQEGQTEGWKDSQRIFCIVLLCLFFFGHVLAYGIFAPWAGMEPMPPGMEV